MKKFLESYESFYSIARSIYGSGKVPQDIFNENLKPDYFGSSSLIRPEKGVAVYKNNKVEKAEEAIFSRMEAGPDSKFRYGEDGRRRRRLNFTDNPARRLEPQKKIRSEKIECRQTDVRYFVKFYLKY